MTKRTGWHIESWTHLDYEIGQMSTCVLIQLAVRRGVVWYPVAVTNALADSTLIRARSLIDFVSKQPNRERLNPRAVVRDWQFKQVIDQGTKRRIHTEIAHLTSARRIVDGRFGPTWSLDEIVPPLLVRLEEFYMQAGRSIPWTAVSVLHLHRAPPDAEVMDIVVPEKWEAIGIRLRKAGAVTNS